MALRHLFTRAGISVLALSTLLGGSILLGATAADAATLPLAITSPTNGATIGSTDGAVLITGTGTSFHYLGIAVDGAYAGNADVGDDGTWSTTVTMPDTAGAPQTITVTDGNSTPSGQAESVTVTVVAVPASEGLAITSPASGSTATSRSVSISGTAPAGSTVSISSEQGFARPSRLVKVGTSGAWTIVLVVEPQDPFGNVVLSLSATVTGFDADGATFTPREVTDIALPTPAPAPVFTSPTAGGTEKGTTATATGTSVGGPAVAVFFSPVGAETQAAANLLPEGNFEVTAPVDAQGHWSASTSLVLGTWVATAVTLTGPDVGTADYASLQTGPHAFTLVAAPAGSTAPGTGSGTSSGTSSGTAAGSSAGSPAASADPTQLGVAASNELAYTGSTPRGLIVASVLMLLAGIGLTAATRRAEHAEGR